MKKTIMPKKSLADRAGEAIGCRRRSPEPRTKAVLGAAGSAVGLVLASAAVSAARERQGGRRAPR